MNDEYMLHLMNRGVNFMDGCHRYFIDDKKELISFLLYSPEGRILGHQQYNWKGTKERNLPTSKYRTFTTEQACWGWEGLSKSAYIVYVTESIFKSLALHNMNLETISILGSTWSKNKKRFFKDHPKYVFVWIGDNDEAGLKAGKYFNHAFQSPKDLDEMGKEELKHFMEGVYLKVIHKMIKDKE